MDIAIVSIAIMLILIYLFYHADMWSKWHDEIDGEARKDSENRH